MSDANYVEVEVVGVGHDPLNRALVVLRDNRNRHLQMVIGYCEALAIVQRMNPDFDPGRPLPQDLALNIWKRLGGTLVRLRIDDFWQQTYYGKLTVEQDGRDVDIDCRPSDGIALALSAHVPIFVADHVMAQDQDS